ncbi:alpha-amylase [Streptococcus intermedius]|uniref:Cytoplasmic alpha-amylase n=1 Tax=Streptococcus intermedius B196 TaxID=862967 RepID=T1ZFH9_STRIT|nr:alpha-amylase [Streptococcus intermedius]AGU76222.1 cytoplasmic alpha-amylase [Streptococcus intermedius B196]MDP1433274.1 alpha-amylase [Streptococcus intermedius]RSJ14217.1 Glucan 1,4-alpha-maltohexaosidase precursor [Streptococcus intermedius]RSJ27177.1 Glucan 1,4-alpha-maltohexaosidase precursor [Streptococcus intermedius]RSJ28634.1 Glucan 1,4-alpha-maltohexaosidase precursor [Streptococcus intermedius]
MENQTLMQYFEWYLPNDGQHWNRLARDAPHLASKGIRKVWMPPAFKATSSNDVGYGIYDLFDLGEFNQKGTVRTKYGLKEEYLKAIKSLKENGIEPIADVVLNHKAAADYKERFTVIEVDPNDRTVALSEPFEIKGWTKFTFPGRHKKYNDFEWHWYHFTGTDYDAQQNKSGIYLIQGDNKGWADDDLVDNENGNFDYLMYADLDFKHPEVIQNLYDWADWFIKTTGIHGFRLDAIKHIDSFFMGNFIRDISAKYGDDFYVFGEFWNSDETANNDYLGSIDYRFDLVDVKLHHNLFDASRAGSGYDLRNIFEQTLVKNHPESAVTFVDNHDTQRGQALESTIEEWFKPAAYALILLREAGLPCVFYGDYYGVNGEFAQDSFQTVLDKLLDIRLNLAYGEQKDYFDDEHCIAWTRSGKDNGQPIAVILTNDQANSKRMYVGENWAGKEFKDYLGNNPSTVIIEEDGWANFPVVEKSVSVWSAK